MCCVYRSISELLGLILLAGGITLDASAQVRPTALSHKSPSAETLQRQPDTTAPDPLLAALEVRLKAALQKETFPAKQWRREGTVLIAEYRTRHEKLYGTDKRGEESKQASDRVVPEPTGIRIELQLQTGRYNGQAVRPQNLHESFRNQAKKTLAWTTYLGDYYLEKADKTLLLNLEYGQKVKPETVARLKKVVDRCVKEAESSAK